MKFRTFFYSLKEALKNIWRNGLMSVASVSSVMATLIILGIIFVLVININSFIEGAQSQFDEITVYLNDEVPATEILVIQKQIAAIIGVKEVHYESKDQAMTNWRESWGEEGYLLEGLSENPLPNAFIIRLRKLEDTESVVNILSSFSGIEEVTFYKDIIDKVMSTSSFIKNMGFGLIAALIAISTFIITNTIKLAVNSRRREINIMKYVGATNWFIRWPFLLEGTILGCIGALLAAAVIFLMYQYSYDYFTTQFFVLIASYFVPVKAIMADLLFIFVVLGSGIGALGSMHAMRKHLNV